MSLETKVDLLSERARPIAPLPNVARKAPSLAPACSIEREPPLRRRRDVLVHVVRHLVVVSVPDVLLLERLVPDRGVASERAVEGDVEVEGNRIVELVGGRVLAGPSYWHGAGVWLIQHQHHIDPLTDNWSGLEYRQLVWLRSLC